MRLLISVVLVLSASSPIYGQEYRQYLVPLTTRNARGALGSIWTTELTAYNSTGLTQQILVRACEPFIFLTPPCYGSTPVEIAPAGVDLRIPDGSEPSIIHVPETVADAIDFELRIRDLSRAGESWGAGLPIVPVDAFRGTIRLFDIPVDAAHRINLRVYGRDARRRTVSVTTYPFPGTTPIETRIVELRSPFEALEDVEHPLTPAYAQIDSISEVVRASGATRLRIEVDSISNEPLWAFASITNNLTQQVTTITPHAR